MIIHEYSFVRTNQIVLRVLTIKLPITESQYLGVCTQAVTDNIATLITTTADNIPGGHIELFHPTFV